ncbi:hypothetical protein SDC9_90927 [bioreactor metagenome]|uniref:Lipoprotein n=1 Tax=bioreactor metagenome TaxID=1076179 RepID=A0A644ZTB8_9ZZZZ
MKYFKIFSIFIVLLTSCEKDIQSFSSDDTAKSAKSFKINNVNVSVIPIQTKSEGTLCYEVFFSSEYGQLETTLSITSSPDGLNTQVFYLKGTQQEIITVISDMDDNIISVIPPSNSDNEYITSESFWGALKYYRNCVAKKWNTLSNYLSENPELGILAITHGHYVAGVFVITSTADCLKEML